MKAEIAVAHVNRWRCRETAAKDKEKPRKSTSSRRNVDQRYLIVLTVGI
jgi:hypothetical protein